MRNVRILVGLLVVGALAACTRTGDVVLPDSGFVLDMGTTPDMTGPVDMFTFPDAIVETCDPANMGMTIGDSCTGNADCDDGCYCNGEETCSGSVCVAGDAPCTDTVECTDDVCLEETDHCFFTPRHDMCSDSNACNGAEMCSTTEGCVAAVDPYCNDENSCTIDSCDDSLGCVYTPRDLDHDGHIDGRCGGDDCDDDPRYGTNIFPGSTEDCTNRRDDDCNGLRDYLDDSCIPTNDTCETAQMIPGAGTYSASTRGLTSNYTLSCGSSGADAIFAFTLTEPKDVRVSASGGSGTTSIAIRSAASCTGTTDLRCGSGASASALSRSLPAGDYTILVKTATAVAFDLVVAIDDPTTVPPVDTCAAGTLDISAGGTFTGNFEDVNNDYQLSCHTGMFKDAAYLLVLPSPKDVVLTANTGTDTYMALVTDCTLGTSLNCQHETTTTLRRRSLPAGTYYVIVESASATAMSWTLTAAITDPATTMPGDSCSSAVDATSSTASINVADMAHDSGTSCGGMATSQRDGFFRFTTTQVRDVQIVTTFPAASGNFVALQGTCGSPPTDTRCRAATATDTQTFRSLPAGTYYIAVVAAGSSGTVSTTVTQSSPTPVPPNDRCAGAIDVSAASTIRNDTLVDFSDDVAGGTCGGFSAPDAIYTLTLPATRVVSVNATRPTAGAMYVVLRNTCAMSGPDLGCFTASMSAGFSQTLPAGTYFLIVETLPSSPSDFQLVVHVDTPP